jgi:hypothetical protein
VTDDPLQQPIPEPEIEFIDEDHLRQITKLMMDNPSYHADQVREQRLPLLFERYGLDYQDADWKALAMRLACDFYPGFMEESEYQARIDRDRKPAHAPLKWTNQQLTYLWCEVESRRRSGQSARSICRDLIEVQPWTEILSHIQDTPSMGSAEETRAEELRQYYYKASKLDLTKAIKNWAKNSPPEFHELLYKIAD